MELLHQNPQEVFLDRAYKNFFIGGSPKSLEIFTQIVLWFSILNAFVIVFDHDASWPLLVTAILLALGMGAYVIVHMGTILAGLLYTGPNVNVQFVKEVLKRHPRGDKLAIYNEYMAQKRNAKVNIGSVNESQDIVELQDVMQE